VASLNHPHICTLYDVGQHVLGAETMHYIVLEMIEGESLATRIARAPLSLDEVLLWGKQVASALDAAHKRGIVHRDLKPGGGEAPRLRPRQVFGAGGRARRLVL
jgi:serine/threonine protein kinase